MNLAVKGRALYNVQRCLHLPSETLVPKTEEHAAGKYRVATIKSFNSIAVQLKADVNELPYRKFENASEQIEFDQFRSEQAQNVIGTAMCLYDLKKELSDEEQDRLFEDRYAKAYADAVTAIEKFESSLEKEEKKKQKDKAFKEKMDALKAKSASKKAEKSLTKIENYTEQSGTSFAAAV